MQILWLILLLVVSGQGCAVHRTGSPASPPPEGARPTAGARTASQPKPPPPKPEDVVLGLGDVLEVTYFKSYAEKKMYRFEVGDAVKVAVANRPELTLETVVLPDGRCTLPLLGPVPLRGKTVDEGVTELRRRYARHFAHPQVDLLVVRPRARLEDFFDVILKTPNGPRREVTLNDGNLVLPLIPPIKAVGRPLAWVRNDVQDAYSKVVPEVRVALALLSRGAKTISVLGEVTHAGVFESPYPISVIRALALAGGVTDRARLSQVLLVRQAPDGKLVITVLDMEKALDGQDVAIGGTVVAPNDVIYVPRTTIADVDVFVDQYLRRMIPIPVGVVGTAF